MVTDGSMRGFLLHVAAQFSQPAKKLDLHLLIEIVEPLIEDRHFIGSSRHTTQDEISVLVTLSRGDARSGSTLRVQRHLTRRRRQQIK